MSKAKKEKVTFQINPSSEAKLILDVGNLPKGTVYFKLPIYEDMKFSLNEIKKHWSVRKRSVDAFHWETETALMEYEKKIPTNKGRVDMIFRFFWKSRALDSSNCAFMAKSIEDAIVSFGVIGNDTNATVRWIAKESVFMEKKDREELSGDEVDVYIVPVTN